MPARRSADLQMRWLHLDLKKHQSAKQSVHNKRSAASVEISIILSSARYHRELQISRPALGLFGQPLFSKVNGGERGTDYRKKKNGDNNSRSTL